MLIDAETREMMEDLELYFEGGGIDVERDERFVYIRVKLDSMDNPFITAGQPMNLRVFRDRVEAECAQEYGEPQTDHQALLTDGTPGDVVQTVDCIETIRAKVTYDLTKQSAHAKQLIARLRRAWQ